LPASAPTPPWTDADRDRALELLVQGHTPTAIAAQLGRPTKQVANLRYLRRGEIAVRQAAAGVAAEDPRADASGRAEAGAAEAPPEAAPPPPHPDPVPTPKTDPASTVPAHISAGLSAAERAIWGRLDSLTKSKVWTPARDLDLAEGLARGDGTPGVAGVLGVTREDVIARWGLINTKRGDLDHQAALLRVLRWRAGAR